MGGWMAKVRVIVGVVGALLICGGILASCFGFVGWLARSGFPNAGQFVSVFWAGLLIALAGVVLCVYITIESSKQEKKGSVPKVRSSDECFCPHCGTKLASGAKFCEECGVRIQDYTPGSGARKGTLCGNCGCSVAANSRFCEYCGTDVK